MTILPINPAANANPDALRAFLDQARAAALRAGRAKLVSISLAVDALDPLAVLESIFEPGEPHFYAERPDIGSAIAGAETKTFVLEKARRLLPRLLACACAWRADRAARAPEQEQELRLEAEGEKPVTLTLKAGTAEIFGVPSLSAHTPQAPRAPQLHELHATPARWSTERAVAADMGRNG